MLDGKHVFTGDSLLKEYPVIVSFPQGNKDAFLEETVPLFERCLRPDMIVLPGHGTPFVLSELMEEGKIHVEFR